ncbi:hypothetical protein [Streptomyces griseofuscus]|uniref:Uncharacterized protein n=1 Tax=Streptomyces griseofuscus TaxID=146922 RepID=A0A7H1PR22_9ACTN|nr:hypothetical protein [Streptomyces griseofuscus]QNT90502.1 hypothetical protein HEP81_00165 [Streptomyces griseofuscus]BBC93106.1 hypothetical protein SRO_1930 [Streptomyces rochei]
MGTFVTVSVLLAMIVIGVIVIQLFTASHDETLTSGRTRRWRFSPWHRTEK